MEGIVANADCLCKVLLLYNFPIANKMETIGNLIDKLTICNIRIWMAEDIKRSPSRLPGNDDQYYVDKQIADATRITNVANQQRTDLIQEIDERLNAIGMGELQKLYKQGDTKMYGKD